MKWNEKTFEPTTIENIFPFYTNIKNVSTQLQNHHKGEQNKMTTKHKWQKAAEQIKTQTMKINYH